MSRLEKIRVAFITAGDPNDKRLWSGIPYFMFLSLQHEFDEVVSLGPYKPKSWIVQKLFSATVRTLAFYSRYSARILKKKYNYTHSAILARFFSSYFKSRLQKEGPFDLIVAPAASTELYNLKSSVPLFYVTDTTFERIHNYYEGFSNLSKRSIRESFRLERRVLSKSTSVIFPSKWAADSAINFYNVSSSKVYVIPFGANIEVEPEQVDVIKKQFSSKLLFLGVDWDRKGGAIAYDCFKELVKRGHEVHLTICGCIPPGTIDHSNITIIPFLDKNISSDFEKWSMLLKQSDFLLLPTRADCYGIVFCEASAFGVPSITSDTGGVGGVVENGVNGFRLPFNADGKAYANAIEELYLNWDRYSALNISTRLKFERELRWSIWSSKIKQAFLQTVEY